MRKLIKKLFSELSRYSLTISGTRYEQEHLICLISDKTNVSPYEIFAKEIFSNDDLLSQIKPRELLKLKELYDSSKESYVLLTESYGNNKFKIFYHGHEFVMTGKDICKDMYLLKSMRLCDCFKIIYDTGYSEAMLNHAKVAQLNLIASRTKEKNESASNNVIFINNGEK